MPAGREARAADRADGAAEEDRRARARRRGSASDVRGLVDGPSAEHELVLQGRLEAGARHRPVVYLTECDPSAYRAGQLSGA